MKEYMNVREIAELTGKAETTVINWINKVHPFKIKHGVETKLDLDEVEELFNKVFGERITSMLIEKTERVKELNSTVQELNSSWKGPLDMLQLMLDEMKSQTVRLDSMEKKQLQIEAPEYYTIKAYVNMHYDEFGALTKGEFISLGRKATRLSKNMMKDIKYVPDDNYGRIGSYHIDILDMLEN